MTPTEKLKAIVDDTPGMCWHEASSKTPSYGFKYPACDKCGNFVLNPSPDIVDDLIALVEENGFSYVLKSRKDGKHYARIAKPSDILRGPCSAAIEYTPAAAILEAMWQTLPKGDV